LLGNPRIIYSVRSDATPETELSALAAVYKVVLESKKAAGPAPEPNNRDGTKKVKGDSANVTLPH